MGVGQWGMGYCGPMGYGTKFLPTNLMDHKNLWVMRLWVKRFDCS
jgi:hypothetical protein